MSAMSGRPGWPRSQSRRWTRRRAARRLRLLSMIASAEEVCSCDLLEPLGKAQPTVSHHTTTLADAGLITGEKRGRWVYWRVVPERVDALRRALTR